jgi:hypothetical protein
MGMLLARLKGWESRDPERRKIPDPAWICDYFREMERVGISLTRLKQVASERASLGDPMPRPTEAVESDSEGQTRQIPDGGAQDVGVLPGETVGPLDTEIVSDCETTR